MLLKICKIIFRPEEKLNKKIMPKQKQIIKLEKEIGGSIFLKEEVKKRLLENLPRVSAQDLDTLAALFGHAEKHQDKLLKQIVKYDDTFVPRLKHFVKGEIRKYRGGVEKAQRKKEKAEDILKEIE